MSIRAEREGLTGRLGVLSRRIGWERWRQLSWLSAAAARGVLQPMDAAILAGLRCWWFSLSRVQQACWPVRGLKPTEGMRALSSDPSGGSLRRPINGAVARGSGAV